jgi:alpha-D-ribose 1-methylphosphonate 5-phosphate C-P lyase
MADSNIVLNFSDNSITANLVAGKAKFSNAAGVATTVATKDATVIADTGRPIILRLRSNVRTRTLTPWRVR